MKKYLILIILLSTLSLKAQIYNNLKVGEDNYYTVKNKLKLNFYLNDETFNQWKYQGGVYTFDVLVLINNHTLELFFADNILYLIKFDEEIVDVDLPICRKLRIDWYDGY